jgi:hypothetical protein
MDQTSPIEKKTLARLGTLYGAFGRVAEACVDQRQSGAGWDPGESKHLSA